jgi:DNA repair protein RecN (Recombination protein N)
MLKYLTIRDFIIVDTLELDFAAGFTALTGETGAGKSILIDALSLALGGRGDAALVRNGCDKLDIAAEFDVASTAELRAWLREQELDGDDHVCLLRRVIDSSGRSRSFINGRSATLQQLREAGEQLLDIHGQHAHQSLLRPAAQRALLDGYADALPQAEQVADLYRDWQAIRRRRISLSENASAMRSERELLQFQRAEIAALNFDAQEWQTLQENHARLAHAASLLDTAAFGIETLGEADAACLPQLHVALSRLHEAQVHDAALGEVAHLLESAQAEIQEAVYALRHYQQRLDQDPQHLQQLELRIQSIMDAARKHRIPPEQLAVTLQHIETRLAELGDDADIEQLQQQEQAAQQGYEQAARKLTTARQRAAKKLAQEITAAMQTLAMQGGHFGVALLPLPEGAAQGLEAIEFQVAANTGAPLRSLAKVASGGELSRISLAIQVAMSRYASVPTLIFDEVDSGIGGRVAEIVGQLLRQLGASHQVLCVTHLPQVAAQAAHQWQVSKRVEQGVTLSGITVLNGERRVAEIARMLGGATITDTALKHAAEMLGTVKV